VFEWKKEHPCMKKSPRRRIKQTEKAGQTWMKRRNPRIAIFK
jgi:hypothetical protein